MKKVKDKEKIKDINYKEKISKNSGEKNIFLTLFKFVMFLIVLITQFVIIFLLYSTASEVYKYATFLFEVIKALAVFLLLYRHDNNGYKVSWIIFIMFLPVVGILVFYLWGNSKLKKTKANELKKIEFESKYTLNDKKLEEEIKAIDRYKYNQVKYMENITGYPICKNEGVTYFKTGEKFFNNLKIDLNKARKYILIEFYILSEGKLWNDIYKILVKKASEGVKIDIIIDSLGSAFTKPKDFVDNMNKIGINVYLFNPFTPVISGYLNYRDHRKIVVIDGVYAYTGGVNLADEYANIIEKFGYWKDVGIKMQGEAVWNNTLIFLRTLEQLTGAKPDYMWYKNIGIEEINNTLKNLKQDGNQDEYIIKNEINNKSKGYILPYADGPHNRKRPVENIYIQTINYAKDYIYITTPYFIVSEALLAALLNSARSGVDVRLILPYIPDKKMIQMVTKSYYEVLLEAGVKVYEFKPGFIHSKTFVVDDNVAIVGTANLDYRSTHLNFECATWIYNTGEEIKIKQDFENMIKESKEINLNEWKNRPFSNKIIETLLSTFSPML
jgi:cardiolipin synthase